MFFLHILLRVNPDINLLKKRLKKVTPYKALNKPSYAMKVSDLANELTNTAKEIKQSEIGHELKDYLANSELAGLELKIRLALNSIAQYLESYD